MNNSNFFIVNTPFQGYVVDRIIEQYFSSNIYNNVVFSTCMLDTSSSTNVFRIRRGFLGIIDIKKMKDIILKDIRKSSFFIPHLNNLFSPYFFYLSKNYNRPINVYYEGIALFYSPLVRFNRFLQYKRCIISIFTGIEFKKYDCFFPKELVQMATCFTPIESFCKQYPQIYKINLQQSNFCNKNNLLFLLPPRIAKDDICDIRKYFNSYSGNKIFIKPHYNSLNSDINYIYKILKLVTKKEIVLLSKIIPIENLYKTIAFNKIIALHFSSALVNAKLLFNSEVEIEILNEIQNKEIYLIAQELNIVS